MTLACLVDTTRCIGCRSCQVACAEAHRLKPERSRFFAKGHAYQNPARLTPGHHTLISFHEVAQPGGRLRWVFAKQQCMHCRVLYCASGCPTQVFRRQDSGEVLYEADNCVGCGACLALCPFQSPAIDYWGGPVPRVSKCDFCHSLRRIEPVAAGRPATACARACPTGALQTGERGALLAEARRRIARDPARYLDQIYGESEAGGLGWLYLAAVPFAQLGLPSSMGPAGVIGPAPAPSPLG